MRIFHVKVFEGPMSAGQTVNSSPSLSELFGSVDRLYIGGYASQPVLLPKLQIKEQISMDGENWTDGALLVGDPTAIDISTAPEALFQGRDYDPESQIFGIKAPFRRLFISVSNTGSAMLHIWVTGRDRARGARMTARAG